MPSPYDSLLNGIAYGQLDVEIYRPAKNLAIDYDENRAAIPILYVPPEDKNQKRIVLDHRNGVEDYYTKGTNLYVGEGLASW